jgi:hypothetical protein
MYAVEARRKSVLGMASTKNAFCKGEYFLTQWFEAFAANLTAWL